MIFFLQSNGIKSNAEAIFYGADCIYDSNKKRVRKSMSVLASRCMYEMGHSGASTSYCHSGSWFNFLLCS
jgi:hypothetical protein